MSRKFTEEDNQKYAKGIQMVRSSMLSGVKFDVACEFIEADEELKGMIIDDALKIEIAELHYGKDLPLMEVSKKLGVSMERLLKANDEMMDDIMNSAAESGRGPGKPTIH